MTMSAEERERKRRLVENERHLIVTNPVYRQYAAGHRRFFEQTYNRKSPQVIYCTQECQCGCKNYEAAVDLGWYTPPPNASVERASPSVRRVVDGDVIVEGPEA